MDLDQELEGFAGYTKQFSEPDNKSIRKLFDAFRTDQDRKWAWEAIRFLLCYFPNLKHIPCTINRKSICITNKDQILNTNEDPIFCLDIEAKPRTDSSQGGGAALWIIKKYRQQLLSDSQHWWITSKEGLDALGAWIKALSKDSFSEHVKSSNSSQGYNMPLNTILYGPPGTGKTYHTINKALEIIDPDFYKIYKGKDTRKALKERFDKLCEENKIVMTTFHQSYTYEDFVEGLRASVKDEKIVYSIEPGVFKKIWEDAEKNPDENFVLIIDEINRGNVSNIFGELITLIEDSKRAGKDEALSVTLPYSKKSFPVPSNLYIVGTMNTADRSLTQIDTALRRRFHFEEMMPNPDLLEGLVIDNINICNLLKCLNERIEALYDREHTLGHAFFMELLEEDKKNIDTLAAIFKNKVIPLLQEYFFDDWGKIQLILGEQVIKEKAQFSNFATSNINNLVIPKAYEIVSGTLKEPDTYINMYKNCLSV